MPRTREQIEADIEHCKNQIQYNTNTANKVWNEGYNLLSKHVPSGAPSSLLSNATSYANDLAAPYRREAEKEQQKLLQLKEELGLLDPEYRRKLEEKKRQEYERKQQEYERIEQEREQTYRNLVNRKQSASTEQDFLYLSEQFLNFVDYFEDARALADECEDKYFVLRNYRIEAEAKERKYKGAVQSLGDKKVEFNQIETSDKFANLCNTFEGLERIFSVDFLGYENAALLATECGNFAADCRNKEEILRQNEIKRDGIGKIVGVIGAAAQIILAVMYFRWLFWDDTSIRTLFVEDWFELSKIVPLLLPLGKFALLIGVTALLLSFIDNDEIVLGFGAFTLISMALVQVFTVVAWDFNTSSYGINLFTLIGLVIVFVLYLILHIISLIPSAILMVAASSITQAIETRSINKLLGR